jgi:hypothetical protein
MQNSRRIPIGEGRQMAEGGKKIAHKRGLIE